MNEALSATKTDLRAGGLRAFFIVWFGQLISSLGSGLTGFALGVYIYQQTGSVTQFSVALIAATVPGLLVSPFAGALADRWDRKWMIGLSDTGAALSTLAIWLLLLSGQLQVWHIYLANAANAFFGSFQNPAYQASISLMVPKKHYGRAAGLGQLSSAVSLIATPILAGFLMMTIHLHGIVLIDFATYLFAVSTLFIVRIPRPETSVEGKAGKGSLWREAWFGWKYLQARQGLMGMLSLFALINFSLGFQNAIFTPLVLSFSTAEVLGSILSAGGLGLLVGSMLMSIWGGTKRKIYSLMGALFVFGLCTSLVGLRPNPYLIGAASFLFFSLLPVAQGSSQAIWQAKVAPDLQGRVFAIRGLIATFTEPVALVMAGPLADHVFEPAMQAGAPLAASLGKIIGVGAGRGMGLIYVSLGLLISLCTAIGWLNPRIRHVEDELPDFSPDQPPHDGV